MNLLDPEITRSDYHVTADLKTASAWKSRILLGNSLSADKLVGEFDDVGYVMVSVIGATRVIPVARSDEHSMGYELLAHLAKHKAIRPKEFFPIAIGGSTGIFIFGDKDIPPALEATRRWIAAGGADIVVRKTGGAPEERWTMASRDFVAGNGRRTHSPDGLLPVGDRFVRTLTTLAEALRELRDPDRPWLYLEGNRHVERRLARSARTLTSMLALHRELALAALHDRTSRRMDGGGTLQEAIDGWSAKMESALWNGDYSGVQDLVFTHGGIKNRVHQEVRRPSPPGWPSDIQALFGDLVLADAALGRVSPGLGVGELAQVDPEAARMR